ncbi:diguanylate cyclase [Pedobacter frigiditerrae]|uniref:Diguanylate cyclase n=1 Tax=Pedobacter frigiditerrae TaxID=2530452 RepID=A0A4R0MQD6_9SPHI|nr:sensor histidine kinase [Pedobacter frigiditerrae]TCC89099.1 diguanylate cyclase [Pedobacter frigiditerrae]
MRIKFPYLFFCLSAFIFVSVLKSNAQTAYLPHYTTKNGLPSNNCYYTLQDKKGFIWVATDAGVSRFDGAVFENFSVDDGLPDNQVLQLREDSKGRIWFLSLNGQLSYYYNGKIYNPDNDKQLKQLNFNAVIVSFLEDSKGRIWFGTNKNIIGVWDGKSLIKYSSPNTEKQYANAFINEDKQGNIWAYSTTATFLYIKSNFVLVEDKLLPLSYKTLTRKDRTVYFLDNTGLNIKNGSETELILNINPELLTNSPGYLYVDKESIWLSNNSGVYAIDFDGKVNQLLKDIDVNQVIKDQDRNIWFTTKNGIYRLPEAKERLYILNKINGLSNDVIKSVTKDGNGKIWMGIGNGINILNPHTKAVQKINLRDQKKYNLVKQLTFDKKNQTMFFSSDYGLGYLSTNNPSSTGISYLKETNNSVFVVKNFSIDTGSRLALSLSSGVVIINDRFKKFAFSSLNYVENKDYFKDRSYRVYYDHFQNLWFSNTNGLTEFGKGLLKKYYQKNSLLTKRINDIKQLDNNIIALATDGYGIVFMQNGKIIKQLKQKDGLNNNIINRLFVQHDFLWAISNTGVNRIAVNQNQFIISSFDYANELLSDDLNDIFIDTDTAYFATNNGLVYFAHSQKSQQTKAPNTYISSVSVNKELLDLSYSSFTLKPEERNITFNYSAIDFKNKKIIYRYRLKDDENWSETRNRRLELSSLEPGEYCFEVSAKSQDSQWSTPTKINFVIEKHFWQTWWFLIIVMVIGAYLLYIITVRITKRQKNKEQEQLLLKNKILMLEQQALQAMMNPHFVFNVMNSIQHYINTQNTSSANKVLTGFAKLIRKNLEICTKSYINLEEEIEYLNLYLSLEKYRFGEKFIYSINVDGQIDKEETQIPSMLLQPYIENAIWHGIMPKEEGGEVQINIDQKDEDYLWIKIIDNGVGIKNSLLAKNSAHQSKGMNLTQERINLLNKIEAKPIQLFIEQNGNSGTTITILVPLS